MASESLQPAEIADLEFEALLTKDDVKELEGVAQGWGINRRLALGVLTQSKAEMLEKFESAPEPGVVADAFMDLYEHIRDYKEHVSHLAQQVETAECRLLVVLAEMHESGRV